MSRIFKTAFLVAAVASLACGTRANATYLLYANPTERMSTTGASEQFDVYLADDAGGTIAADGGLLTAVFTVEPASGDGLFTGFAAGTGFEPASPDTQASVTTIGLISLGAVMPSEDGVLLGILQVKAGSVTTVFNLSIPGGIGSNDTITAKPTTLDSEIQGSELTVAVIPEPATMVPLGACLMLAWRRRRRDRA